MKRGPSSQFTLHRDRPAMLLNDSFGESKPYADTLLVLGKTAAVKPVKDMMHILRVNTQAVIPDYDPREDGGFIDLYLNPLVGFGVIQGVFDNIADRLQQPFLIKLIVMCSSQ